MRLRKCYLILLAAFFVSIHGCSEKKEDKQTQQPSLKPQIINITLKDGNTIKIDAAKLGVSSFPKGDIISYTQTNDERRVLDDIGNPIIQPVLKHQVFMETTIPIEELIKFFFDKAPHIITKRKVAGKDVYVRIVSTKESVKSRSLEQPYIVIDMFLSNPSGGQIEPDNTGALLVQPQKTASPLDNQISSIKSQIELIDERLAASGVSIPERRAYEGQKTMFKDELERLMKISIAEQSRVQPKDNESKTVFSNTVKERPAPMIKVKIISYNKRG